MESEKIKIFDKDRNELGVATREEVHKFGYWHETFHCWFIAREEEIDYIYFQIRSDTKKDYPNLLDITAAGHILAHETVYDGVREIKEEVGIDISMNELISLGLIEYCVVREEFVDKELAHTFLYLSKHGFNEYELQKEEVSGIVRSKFNDFYEFCMGDKEEIRIQGFQIDNNEKRKPLDQLVNKDNFVPHEASFYKKIAHLISKHLR